MVLLLLFFSYIEKNKQRHKFALWMMGSTLVLFFGLRGFVQTDWELYYWMYERVPSFWQKGFYFEKKIEPGFMIYIRLCKSLGMSYFFWVFLNSVINISVLTILFRRYSSSVARSWIFFFCFSGLVVEINLMRNVKSILLILLSLPYIQDRNFFKFLGLWLIAVCVHFSAVLYFPIYFILYRNWGRLLPLILFGFVNIVFFFEAYPTSFLMSHLDGFINPFIEKAFLYMKEGREQLGFSFGYFERTAVFLLVYLLYDRLISQRRSNLLFCNCIYLYYTFWYIFSDVPVFVERVPILFVFGYWIILPNLMVFARGNWRRVVNVVAICFALIKVSMTTSHILYDYDNHITGIRPHGQRHIEKLRYEGSTKHKRRN